MKSKPKLFVFRVLDAVNAPECTLRLEVRYLLTCLAQAAAGRTGVGLAGQARIAGMMGVTDRAVRKLFTELEQAVQDGTSPVRVVRRKRFLSDRRGRTSDEYEIQLINRNGGSACSDASTGTAVPDAPAVQPERNERSTGTGRSFNRNSGSGDQRRDQIRDQRSTSAPRSRKREKPPPVEGSHDLKLHYVAEYERRRGVKPEFGKQWSLAMKALGELVTAHGLDAAKGIVTRAFADDWVATNRCQPWEIARDANKWRGRQPNANGKVGVQQGLAPGIKLGRPDYAPRQPDSGYFDGDAPWPAEADA